MTAAHGPRSTPFSLDWLLQPVAAGDFFRDHWERRPLLVSRERPDYFAGLLDVDDGEELITATTPNATRSTEDATLVRSDQDGVVSRRTIPVDTNGLPDIQGDVPGRTTMATPSWSTRSTAGPPTSRGSAAPSRWRRTTRSAPTST